MKKFKKGYTLIELLIFMGMFSILIVVFTEILGSVLDVRRESESVSAVEQDGSFLLNRLSYDISRATSINSPNLVGTTDTVLDLTIDGVNYVYALNGSDLELTTGGSSYQINGVNTTVSNLSFTRIGNDDGKDTIQLSYTLTSVTQRAGVGSEVRNYQITVGLR